MLLQLVETVAIIPTTIILAIAVIQAVLIAKKYRKTSPNGYTPSVSVLIPAHNEEKYISKSLDSVIDSGYEGKVEIIAIDDGSSDRTPEILKGYEKRGLIRLIKTDHIGKSRALNAALKESRGEIIVTMDADTTVQKGSFSTLMAPFSDRGIGATTAAVKIANPKKLLTMFQRIEYMYLSFSKVLVDKIGGTISPSGTCSAFRKEYLESVGGVSPTMLTEDVDAGLKLIRKGYRLKFVPEAVSYTYAPESVRDLFRQRMRWSRGLIQVTKSHKKLYFRKKNRAAGYFTLPTMSYWHFHAILVIFVISLQIGLGYYYYFLANGVAFSPDVFLFFFYWFSFIGILNLAFQMIVGNYPVTALSVLSVALVLLTYSEYAYSFRFFRERIGVRDVIALVFMFPYWILLSVIQIACVPEWFRKDGKNIWKK